MFERLGNSFLVFCCRKLNELASDVPQESNKTQENGHCCDSDETVTELTNDMDDVGCNNDCIFKNTNTHHQLTDDQIDGLDYKASINKTDCLVSFEVNQTKNHNNRDDVNFLNNKHVINGDKTDDCNDCELGIIRKVKSISINDEENEESEKNGESEAAGDINHNNHDGDVGSSGNAVVQEFGDSDTEYSVSGTVERSIETSTDTIVAENFVTR